MTAFIPLMVPDIREEDINAVVAVLKSGMLIQGKNVELLEKRISDFLGVKNVVAVSNGTATMHIALRVLGIGPGDEVIVPAFSYVATANVVELVGATPIFVDIDPHTFNIDADKISNVLTSRTKAIIPVHEFGLACDIQKIRSIAEENKLFVIEDAACALGASTNGEMVGTLSDFGSFSLHPRKAITSGEGGLITTNNDEFATKCRILRNHGISYESGKMEFVDAGFNYRMTDFQAALVLNQAERLPDIFEKRTLLAERYVENLKDLSLCRLPQVPSLSRHTWQTFHIVLNDIVNRDQFIKDMAQNNVGVNYGAQCIPAQIFYQKQYSLDCAKEFPEALRAFKSGLALPLYEKMSVDDVDLVCRAVRKCINAQTL